MLFMNVQSSLASNGNDKKEQQFAKTTVFSHITCKKYGSKRVKLKQKGRRGKLGITGVVHKLLCRISAF